jgi:redox-sensing transcriptional repressor
MEKVSRKTVERLIIYRKILNQLKYSEISNIYSPKLGELAGSTSVQVRRDLMTIGYNGTPSKGYDVGDLENSISAYLDNPKGENIAIIGMGNLGSSLLENCYWNYPNLSKIIAFDVDKQKVGTEINNCKIYHVDDMKKIISEEKIEIAVIAVPDKEAQSIVNKLITYGIKGILNYTPVRLLVPDNIFVEELDMMIALVRVSYFVRVNKI